MYFPRNPECCIYSFDFILGAIMMDFHQRFQDCWRELPLWALCNGDDRRWHVSSGRNCWKEIWSRQRSPVAAVEPRIGGLRLGSCMDLSFVIGEHRGTPWPIIIPISDGHLWGIYNTLINIIELQKTHWYTQNRKESGKNSLGLHGDPHSPRFSPSLYRYSQVSFCIFNDHNAGRRHNPRGVSALGSLLLRVLDNATMFIY